MAGVKIYDDGTKNPLIEIPEEMLIDWLKSVARDAGYGDRALSAVQVGIRNAGSNERQTWLCVPELLIMVSNIPDSAPTTPSPAE